ncbi:hypothetical protein LXL04_033188 [Taraxacum kok-saghyz]
MEVFLEQFQDLKHFELKEMKSITANSDDNKVIREGRSEAFLEQFQDLQYFELKEMKSITANSDDNKVIREGRSEKVYSGVAFKRLNLISIGGQGNPKFVKEIFMLSRTHDDLISCVGFCSEDDEKVVVYQHEYHGSLDCHLNNTTVVVIVNPI